MGPMDVDRGLLVQFVKDRTLLEERIGKFKSVSHKIADMKVRIELSRLILYKIATMKAQGERAPMESAIAKLFISESYVAASLDALQIHGASGYTTELDFERNLRDSIAGKIYSGTSEIQRNIIASLLGL